MRYYLFSFTNNHPTKTIEVEEISLTLTGPGDGVAVFVGLPGNDFELGDDFFIEEETTLVFSRAFDPGVPLDVAPGETFYVSPVDTGSGFLVSNATITGTAVPEPSSFLLALTGAAALLRRRRQ